MAARKQLERAMANPDAAHIAEAMRAMKRHLDRGLRSLMPASPAGDCLLDAANDTEFPSSNGNAITGMGIEAAPTVEQTAAWLAAYRAAGVRRCFAWVHQGRAAAAARSALAAAGFAPFKGPDYPTLVRAAGAPAPAAPCPSDIVELDADARARHQQALARLYRDAARFFAVAALPGATCVAACEHGVPIAASVVVRLQGWAWLGWMSTAEAHRRRGAQRALIAARLALAGRDCQWAVAETLSILAASLRNLAWAGFAHAYDKQVWMASPQAVAKP
jgi:hypothetical protein